MTGASSLDSLTTSGRAAGPSGPGKILAISNQTGFLDCCWSLTSVSFVNVLAIAASLLGSNTSSARSRARWPLAPSGPVGTGIADWVHARLRVTVIAYLEVMIEIKTKSILPGQQVPSPATPPMHLLRRFWVPWPQIPVHSPHAPQFNHRHKLGGAVGAAVGTVINLSTYRIAASVEARNKANFFISFLSSQRN